MTNKIKMILTGFLFVSTTSAMAMAPLMFDYSREAVEIANVTKNTVVQRCLKQVEEQGHTTFIESIKSLDTQVYYYELALLEGGDMVVGHSTIKVFLNSKAHPLLGPSYLCQVIETKLYE